MRGAKYHVIGRVNHKDHLIESDEMKSLFEDVLVRAKSKFKFVIENFVVMDNHYHLIITPDEDENLSKIMQWIMSVFAMAYNRRNNCWGHFWGGRFVSRIIDSLSQYIKVFDYIDNNPVKAGLVDSGIDWIHGGLHHHRFRKKHLVSDLPDFLNFLFVNHIPRCLSPT